jgi:hypothetical protein
MVSITDDNRMQGNTLGVVDNELTPSDRGKEGMEADLSLHEVLYRLKFSIHD